jgi:site-specific DNA-methyltransferase (cytosine-N4-specific)
MAAENSVESVLAGEQAYALLQGDAFDLLGRLPAACVDLVITSPPYWGLRDYEAAHNWDILDEWEGGKNAVALPSYDWYREHGGTLGLEPMPEWYVANVASILSRCQRVLKPTGSLWLNLGDTYFARWSSIRSKGRQGLNGDDRQRRKTPMGGFRQEKQLLLIPARVAIAMQEHRWILRNDLIWYKPNVPPRPFDDRLGLTHEHFFHFVLRPKEGRAKYYYDLVEAGSNHDVQKCNVVPGRDEHSASFPPKLIEPRICSSCPPDGIVLDPFVGVGTALEVALATGRRGIGFDANKRFLAAAERRLQGVPKPLF